MTDMGRRRGDMQKSTYDADDSGVVDDSEATAAHASTHQDGGSDEVSCAGLAGRINYVDRGDPASVDFNSGTLTTDGTWNDLDLSSIVPEGTKAVIINLELAAGGAGAVMSLRKNGNTNQVNIATQKTQAAIYANFTQVIVACDTNRVIEYLAANTAWLTLNVVIAGYFI